MQLENVNRIWIRFGVISGNRGGYVQFDTRLLVNFDHTCMKLARSEETMLSYMTDISQNILFRCSSC